MIEGQHRLAAAVKLGYTKVPILRVMDLGRVYGYDAMKEAASKVKPMGSDQLHQIVCHALDAIYEEGGSVEKAMEFELSPAYNDAFQAALMAAKRK